MKEQKVHTITRSNLSGLKEEIDIASTKFISAGWKIKQISIAAVPETNQSSSRALAVFLLERYKKKK
jgi:hypothetical protein